MDRHRSRAPFAVCCWLLVSSAAWGQSLYQADRNDSRPASFDPYSTSPDPFQLVTDLEPVDTSERDFWSTLCSPYRDVYGRCRQFPLAASLALDRGYDLPLPFGVQGVYSYLRAEPAVRDIAVSLAGGAPFAPPVGVQNLKNNTHTTLARVDGWLFPFLNVYGIFGDTSVTSEGTLVLPNPLPGANIEVPLRFSTHGPTYGFGLVAAVGYRNWFLVADGNLSETDLNAFDSEIRKWTGGLRTGLRTEGQQIKASCWLGATYLQRRTQIIGTINSGVVAIDPIRYSIISEFDKSWFPLIGTNIDWTPSWNFSLEYTFGDLHQITSAIGYRF